VCGLALSCWNNSLCLSITCMRWCWRILSLYLTPVKLPGTCTSSALLSFEIAAHIMTLPDLHIMVLIDDVNIWTINKRIKWSYNKYINGYIYIYIHGYVIHLHVHFIEILIPLNINAHEYAYIANENITHGIY
jgi:hypothetical protein